MPFAPALLLGKFLGGLATIAVALVTLWLLVIGLGLITLGVPPNGEEVLRGAAFLVAVDLRVGSPTLGKWVGIEATAENRKQVWAPASFARGFCALKDDVEVQYKCTGTYSAKSESAIRWNDPQIGIEWPVREVIVSEKDRNAQTLAEWLASQNAWHFPYAA